MFLPMACQWMPPEAPIRASLDSHEYLRCRRSASTNGQSHKRVGRLRAFFGLEVAGAKPAAMRLCDFRINADRREPILSDVTQSVARPPGDRLQPNRLLVWVTFGRNCVAIPCTVVGDPIVGRRAAFCSVLDGFKQPSSARPDHQYEPAECACDCCEESRAPLVKPAIPQAAGGLTSGTLALNSTYLAEKPIRWRYVHNDAKAVAREVPRLAARRERRSDPNERDDCDADQQHARFTTPWHSAQSPSPRHSTHGHSHRMPDMGTVSAPAAQLRPSASTSRGAPKAAATGRTCRFQIESPGLAGCARRVVPPTKD